MQFKNKIVGHGDGNGDRNCLYHQMLTYSCLRVDRIKVLGTNQQNFLMYSHTE